MLSKHLLYEDIEIEKATFGQDCDEDSFNGKLWKRTPVSQLILAKEKYLHTKYIWFRSFFQKAVIFNIGTHFEHQLIPSLHVISDHPCKTINVYLELKKCKELLF